MSSTDSSNRPPRWAENLVRVLLKPRDRDTIAGDLLEQYREAVRPAHGRFRADLWYLTQALSIIDGIAWGALLGLAFGLADLLYTWINPLADDSAAALLTFYGPMFAAWGLAGFMATRRSGRIRDAIQAGTIIALVTFVVFYLANIVRVNLFLETLRDRADWQNMVGRFGSSGWQSLRAFINYDYLKGAPFKIGVASFIGATVGLFGGLTARVTRWRSAARKDRLLLPMAVVGVFLAAHSVASAEFPVVAWRTASPESQGLDSAVLAEALDHVRTSRIPAHSFLILRNGVIVLDAYFYPYQGLELHDIASSTKSITSAAVGIAIGEGLIKNIDQQVSSLLPLGSSSEADRRKERLTVRHLLTMTSGLDCDTEGGERALAAMRLSSDWAAFALALPMRSDPGSRYAYCSCNNHLLSSLVTAATGESLLQFAEKRLFQPVGIKDVIWPSDPKGRTHGWGDLHLHPRDMARLGYLFLNNGKWVDAQIVPESWVQESRVASVAVRPGVGYGYSWWINTARPPIFEAVGRGGQRISILPKENMVVVFTGGGADTDQIAPFLFRAIRSDRAIPENPPSQDKLKQALLRSAKSIAEPPNRRTPKLAKQSSGVAYTLSNNPLDLRSIQFDFGDKKEASAILQFEGSRWSVPIGLDGVRRFAPVGPHGLSVATAGRWVSDAEFLVDLDTVANVNHFILNARFDGNRLRLRMNETSGELKDFIVQGVASRTAK